MVTIGRLDLAGLEQTEGTLADVGELVGDYGVEPGLGEAELDEPTLRSIVPSLTSVTVRSPTLPRETDGQPWRARPLLEAIGHLERSRGNGTP